MKFANIFGNPPFQDNETKKKTQHKIWPIFTQKAVSEWLEDDGNLFWITPYSWGSPSSKILTLLKENQLQELNLDTDAYFPNVGSTFSNYRLVKSPTSSPTTVTRNGHKFTMTLDDDVFYIPNDVCGESLGIHSKVMFGNENTFDLNYDYVTCHNVIRHGEKLNEEKIRKAKESIKKLVDLEKHVGKSFDKKLERLSELVLKRGSVDISVSETQTQRHIHPLLHTNNKTWYSSKLQTFAGHKKVMWSRSGYVKPFYDNGKLGCTDMGYYILVDSDLEGERLVGFLSSDLMKYVFKTAKWSGFGNELVFSEIPKIDLTRNMKNQDYYELFGISKQEQVHVQSILNPQKPKKNEKSAAETKSKFRVKKHGEVFTPKELVNQMMDSLPVSNWKNEDETFLDPACGNGNFLVEILARRLDVGVSPVSAVTTLYGIDVMQDNIDESIDRMCEVLISRGHDSTQFIDTIKSNIVLSNSLEHTMEEIFKD